MRSPDLLNAINQSLPKLREGSLCFWGDWFGKPYDNQHRITAARWSEDFDVIHFDEGESLLVKNPRGWSLAGGRLLIKEADLVRFQWFYYGRAPGPDTLQYVEYRQARGTIEFSTDFLPSQILPTIDLSKPAVELHAI